MKKVISIALAGAAVFALSGCATGDGGGGFEECHVTLKYLDATNGSGSASSIRVNNNSDYVIDKIYSGINGNTKVSSIHIPINPGDFVLADSGRCSDDEILRIVDEEGCRQQLNFYRACNETANFEVVNNF